MCTPILAIQIVQVVSMVVEAIFKSGIIQELIDYFSKPTTNTKSSLSKKIEQ